MDSARFLEELPRLFDDFPASEHPRDRQFRSVAEDVENLARENNLALINLAASCLGDGEAYVEIGVYHGASLIAAMLGNEGKRFVGVDSFSLGEGSLEKVEANLARYGLPVPEIVLVDLDVGVTDLSHDSFSGLVYASLSDLSIVAVNPFTAELSDFDVMPNLGRVTVSPDGLLWWVPAKLVIGNLPLSTWQLPDSF